ncbi:baseplate J/gp47 family protein [Janthinobacterium sp. Ant5-2-1]|uniref:baseplate assembly protein n=1 Tax=Janthinobacterium sp. Ant5-2-1 TaxID=1755239 RepID=UPI000AD0AE5A
MSTPIDLTQLPAPSVVEVLDFEAILATRKAHLVSLLPEAERAAVTALLELESEPATKLLEENSYQETILRNRVNEAGKAVMLAFALDGDLDQLGANVNVARLVITPANPNALPPVLAVMEDNDAYRLRIQEAPDGLSVAGPKASYEFHARSSDGRVKDASATSPAPAHVTVTVLANDATGIPSAELLAIVARALNAEEVRPPGRPLERASRPGHRLPDRSHLVYRRRPRSTNLAGRRARQRRARVAAAPPAGPQHLSIRLQRRRARRRRAQGRAGQPGSGHRTERHTGRPLHGHQAQCRGTR